MSRQNIYNITCSNLRHNKNWKLDKQSNQNPERNTSPYNQIELKKRGNRKIEHGFHKFIPQILRGASSSKRLGWLKKISFETTQSCLISASESCTCFPGRPLTSSSLSIIPSRTLRSIPKFKAFPSISLSSKEQSKWRKKKAKKNREDSFELLRY